MSESKETSIQFNMRIKVGVEIRFDPLVGSQTRINPARASRPMSSAPSDTLSQLIAEFKDKDPFAPYEKLVAMVRMHRFCCLLLLGFLHGRVSSLPISAS